MILHRPDTYGRVAKWMIELAEFKIKFQPWSSIKAQILVDFVVECTISDDPKMPEPTQEQDTPTEQSSSGEPDDSWIVHMDGSLNSIGLEAGPLLGPEGFVAKYALGFNFLTINNEAEYEALLSKLRIAKELGVRKLRFCIDSQLVAG